MKGITPIIAIVLLLLMTVAAAGTAYLWFTSTQGRIQQQVSGRITSTGANIQFQITGLVCDSSSNNISFYVRNQGDAISAGTWVLTAMYTNGTTLATATNASAVGTIETGGIKLIYFTVSGMESSHTYSIRVNAPGGGEQSATCTAS